MLKMDEFVELGNHEFVGMVDDDQIVPKNQSLSGEMRKIVGKASTNILNTTTVLW